MSTSDAPPTVCEMPPTNTARATTLNVVRHRASRAAHLSSDVGYQDLNDDSVSTSSSGSSSDYDERERGGHAWGEGQPPQSAHASSHHHHYARGLSNTALPIPSNGGTQQQTTAASRSGFAASLMGGGAPQNQNQHAHHHTDRPPVSPRTVSTDQSRLQAGRPLQLQQAVLGGPVLRTSDVSGGGGAMSRSDSGMSSASTPTAGNTADVRATAGLFAAALMPGRQQPFSASSTFLRGVKVNGAAGGSSSAGATRLSSPTTALPTTTYETGSNGQFATHAPTAARLSSASELEMLPAQRGTPPQIGLERQPSSPAYYAPPQPLLQSQQLQLQQRAPHTQQQQQHNQNALALIPASSSNARDAGNYPQQDDRHHNHHNHSSSGRHHHNGHSHSHSHRGLTVTPHAIMARRTCNILVIGGSQCGKSALINSYRAAVTQNDKWPQAPVGICGLHGTTTVEPCPNHPVHPSWLLVDTPGHVYEDTDDDCSDDSLLLSRLFEGIPWHTKLVGRGAVTLAELTDDEPIPQNRAHHCIVVVAATELVADQGFSALLRFKPRYVPTSHAPLIVHYLSHLLNKVRDLLGNVSPFLVVTHMDLLGGADCTSARAVILDVLKRCAPRNAVYFVADAPSNGGSANTTSYGGGLTAASPGAVGSDPTSPLAASIAVDEATRGELLRLHKELVCAVSWAVCQDQAALGRIMSYQPQ